MRGRSTRTVFSHRGQRRSLLPLPRIKTEESPLCGATANCKSAIMVWAASLARAPVLYRNSRRA